MHKRTKVAVYDFANNKIPGQEPKEAGYWRDVGDSTPTTTATWTWLAVDPKLSLYNSWWPIYTAPNPTRRPRSSSSPTRGRPRRPRHRLAGERRLHHLRGRVDRSVISPNVRINSYADVSESILFEGVKVGRRARIRRAIIDKYVDIPAGVEIGYDPEEDSKRFSVSPKGIVIVPKGMRLSG